MVEVAAIIGAMAARIIDPLSWVIVLIVAIPTGLFTSRTNGTRKNAAVFAGGASFLAMALVFGAITLSNGDLDPFRVLQHSMLWGLIGALLGRFTFNYRGRSVGSLQSTVPAQSAPSTGAATYVKEIEQLAELKEKGLLTEDEFAAKKKQVLDL